MIYLNAADEFFSLVKVGCEIELGLFLGSYLSYFPSEYALT